MRTLKEEFNEYLENKLNETQFKNTLEEVYTRDYYTRFIYNDLPGTEINYNLEIRYYISNAIEYYAKFGRERFLEEKELFLEYKKKKDFKEKLENKYKERNVKQGVKKI